MKKILLIVCLTLSLHAMTQIPTDSLIAWYPFNGNAKDSSGNGNDGTDYGAVLTTDKLGIINSSYSFNGTDSYIVLPSKIDIKNSISISFWLKTSVIDWGSWPWTTFVISRDINNYSYNRDWSVTIGSGGKIQFATGIAGGVDVLTSNTDINTNNWIHILLIRDAQNGLKRIYINGHEDQQGIFDNGQFQNYSTDIYVGSCNVDQMTHRFYEGLLDDIRIYNRALNESEVRAIYYEGGWGFKPLIYTILGDQVICKNKDATFEIKSTGISPFSYQWQKDGADIPGATDSVLNIIKAQPEDVGEYRCIAFNSYGIDTSNTATLRVEFAVPTEIHGFTNVAEYQVATYSVEVQQGHTYEFAAEGGNRIDGTWNSIRVQWGTAGQGFVKIVETSDIGCDADTNTLNVFIGSLGVEEPAVDDQRSVVKVYPNPSNGITIFYYSLPEPSQVAIQIYNAYGQLMDTPVNAYQQSGNHQVQWNAGVLPTGVYFYKFLSGKLSGSGKIVLNKF